MSWLRLIPFTTLEVCDRPNTIKMLDFVFLLKKTKVAWKRRTWRQINAYMKLSEEIRPSSFVHTWRMHAHTCTHLFTHRWHWKITKNKEASSPNHADWRLLCSLFLESVLNPWPPFSLLSPLYCPPFQGHAWVHMAVCYCKDSEVRARWN